MKNYKTIIWDWNGTLLNDVWLCVDIVNTILPRHGGLQLDQAYYRSVFGFPITEYYGRIGIDLEKESMEVLTKEFIGAYDKKVLQCNLHDNVYKVLHSFEASGKGQYILTAAHKETVVPLLDHHKISDHFIAIEGLDNHRAESKIHRGHVLLRQNEIKKEKTVLIGDTDHDFEVAEALGIDCVLVANGHQSKKRLLEIAAGRGKVLNNLGELLQG